MASKLFCGINRLFLRLGNVTSQPIRRTNLRFARENATGHIHLKLCGAILVLASPTHQPLESRCTAADSPPCSFSDLSAPLPSVGSGCDQYLPAKLLVLGKVQVRGAGSEAAGPTYLRAHVQRVKIQA